MKNKKNKNKKTTYGQAIPVLDAILQVGTISALIIDENGKGKTTLLNALSDHAKIKVYNIQSIDYGGLRHLKKLDEFKEIDAMAITDMQNIIMRKQEVMYSTFMEISKSIDGLESHSADYQTVKSMKKIDFNVRPQKPIIFIIACTPTQLERISYSTFNDFLSRFVVIKLEREKDFLVEDFPWNKLNGITAMDTKFHDRKEKITKTMQHIANEVKFKIPYYTWNVNRQQWKSCYAQFPLRKKMIRGNTQGKSAQKEKEIF